MVKREQNEKKMPPSGNIQTEAGIIEIDPEIEGFTSEDKGFQAVKYFFTYHIKTDEQFKDAFDRLESLKLECDKFIWSEEYGKKGNTPHIQGALILSYKMRAKTLERYFKNGVTLRKLKNWNAAFKYCCKEGNRIETNGKIKKAVKLINPTYHWEQEILGLLEQEPDDRSIHVYWSEKGGVGKTQFCKYLTVKHGAICVGGKAADMKNAIVEYYDTNDDYPSVCVMNLARGEELDYIGTENIKDMYFYSGKYKGGMICGNCPHLIIFCNEDISQTNKLSLDRWKVHKIDRRDVSPVGPSSSEDDGRSRPETPGSLETESSDDYGLIDKMPPKLPPKNTQGVLLYF